MDKKDKKDSVTDDDLRDLDDSFIIGSEMLDFDA